MKGNAVEMMRRMAAWYSQHGPATAIALEALGSMQRIEQLGLTDMLAGGSPAMLDSVVPASRGGEVESSFREKHYSLLAQTICQSPQARAAIAKIRRFDAAGDVEAIHVELAYWLGVGEGFRLPGSSRM